MEYYCYYFNVYSILKYLEKKKKRVLYLSENTRMYNEFRNKKKYILIISIADYLLFIILLYFHL